MTRRGAARNLPKLNTSKYCIAYLDFLGATESMKKNDNKFLNHIYSVYFNALNDVAFTNVVTQKDIGIKIFSDNILLSVKIEDDDPNRVAKIEKIINLAGNMYNDALNHGYLIRGGITEGEFYKDDNDIFVYGKALIEAINLEEKIAIYPRIVVQNSIKESNPQYFHQDKDGVWYLDSFIFTGLYNYISYKLQLLKMLKQNSKNEKVRQKIMWAISYFNLYNSRQQQIGSVDCSFISQDEIDDILYQNSEVADAAK